MPRESPIVLLSRDAFRCISSYLDATDIYRLWCTGNTIIQLWLRTGAVNRLDLGIPLSCSLRPWPPFIAMLKSLKELHLNSLYETWTNHGSTLHSMKGTALEKLVVSFSCAYPHLLQYMDPALPTAKADFSNLEHPDKNGPDLVKAKAKSEHSPPTQESEPKEDLLRVIFPQLKELIINDTKNRRISPNQDNCETEAILSSLPRTLERFVFGALKFDMLPNFAFYTPSLTDLTIAYVHRTSLELSGPASTHLPNHISALPKTLTKLRLVTSSLSLLDTFICLRLNPGTDYDVTTTVATPSSFSFPLPSLTSLQLGLNYPKGSETHLEGLVFPDTLIELSLSFDAFRTPRGFVKSLPRNLRTFYLQALGPWIGDEDYFADLPPSLTSLLLEEIGRPGMKFHETNDFRQVFSSLPRCLTSCCVLWRVNQYGSHRPMIYFDLKPNGTWTFTVEEMSLLPQSLTRFKGLDRFPHDGSFDKLLPNLKYFDLNSQDPNIFPPRVMETLPKTIQEIETLITDLDKESFRTYSNLFASLPMLRNLEAVEPRYFVDDLEDAISQDKDKPIVSKLHRGLPPSLTLLVLFQSIGPMDRPLSLEFGPIGHFSHMRHLTLVSATRTTPTLDFDYLPPSLVALAIYNYSLTESILNRLPNALETFYASKLEFSLSNDHIKVLPRTLQRIGLHGKESALTPQLWTLLPISTLELSVPGSPLMYYEPEVGMSYDKLYRLLPHHLKSFKYNHSDGANVSATQDFWTHLVSHRTEVLQSAKKIEE